MPISPEMILRTTGLTLLAFVLGSCAVHPARELHDATSDASSMTGRAEPAVTPNIVIFFADDLGYGDLACYGHPTIRTPRLDRMAAEGMRFTSFYSASPACTQSRASLLTGRYSVRCGLPHVIMPAGQAGLPQAEITLAEALRDAGYRTALVGKWHLGHHRAENRPLAHGFDSYYGMLYSNDMIRPWVDTDRPLELWRDDAAIEHPVDQSTITRRYTDEAVRIIEEATTAKRPFFLLLAHSMPHVPLHVDGPRRGTSRAGLYGDVVEEIDASTGRILDTLARCGADDDTIVVFTSDNGPWRAMPDRMFRENKIRPWDAGSAGPLRGSKGMTWEGGQRVPAILRWPGVVPAGTITRDTASTLDLFPTLLGFADAAVPADHVIDGRDIRGLLAGGDASSAPFFYFRNDVLEAVRDGRWKLRLSKPQPGADASERALVAELYDLEVDPAETWNRAAEVPEVTNRLERLLRNFADSIEGARTP